MKYSVCVGALFGGMDYPEGMRRIKEAGIETFEFWSWWDQDIEAIAAEKEKLGLTVAAICTRFISLVDPQQHDDYLAGLKETIEVAKKLDCHRIISQVGSDTGAPRTEQHKALCDGLKRAARMLEGTGIVLVIEPLNTAVDHPGYYLSSSKEAFDIVDEVGSENVRVLFDIYHQQITEGDVIRSIRDNIGLIGHFHAAGNPGRHELDDGELNYANIVKAIDETEYTGYMGLEYFPLRPAMDGLKTLP